MSRGKIILVEGTDCSGKETQTDLLLARLRAAKYRLEKFSFPMYDTPTGRIIAGPYLGKEGYSHPEFSEGATEVDPLVASPLYTIDRMYNIHKIEAVLETGAHVLLDRYIFSNFAHQGGKIADREKRLKLYKKLELLEFEYAELPKPDATILLYMPYESGLELKANRAEALDQHESNKEHLLLAEQSYLELADIYGWEIINCAQDGQVRTIEDIHEDVYKRVRCLI